MPLSPKCHSVVDRVGAKNPCHVTSNDKSQVTVLGCVNAAGFCMPPFIVHKRKTINDELVKGELPGSAYGLSKNGWMDTDLFCDWFSQHFLMHAPSARPLLLLMDGHSSHYCPTTISRAAKEQVILFTLPPNTTHLSQPLDKSGFGPLKTAWKEVCHKFCVKNPGRVVTVYDFSFLFAEAWKQSMTIKNICGGFEVTGIYPFNRGALIQPPSYQEFDPHSLSKKSGLAYIPLYTPASPRVLAPSSHSTPIQPTRLIRSSSSPHLNTPDREDSRVSRTSDDCVVLRCNKSFIGKFLKLPEKPSDLPTKYEKVSGRVLTSAENRAIVKEKEEKKRQKQQEKEERAQLRKERAEAKKTEARKKKNKSKEEDLDFTIVFPQPIEGKYEVH